MCGPTISVVRVQCLAGSISKKARAGVEVNLVLDAAPVDKYRSAAPLTPFARRAVPPLNGSRRNSGICA